MGKAVSPEMRARISATLTGRKLPAETRAKMSAAHRGQPKSAEYRAKAKAAYSDERRARMSAMFKGIPRSAETRAKMSAALVGHAPRVPTVKGECVYCFGQATCWDHVIPRGRPGWDDPDNVVPACYDCNLSKGPRTPEEWLAAMTNGRRYTGRRRRKAA